VAPKRPVFARSTCRARALPMHLSACPISR
jgi:hypothetical protein